MTEPRTPDPVLLVVAAFSRHLNALQWAKTQLETIFGPVGLTSPDFPFTQTKYYEATMGPGLTKRFLAFRRLLPPETLAAVKLQANDLERRLAESGSFAEGRPLNLDPAFLTLGKFMLATTKDQAHRIYLRDGIYAEVTLRFQDKGFEPWPWTYADYLQPEVRSFLKKARDFYRQRLREESSTEKENNHGKAQEIQET